MTGHMNLTSIFSCTIVPAYQKMDVLGRGIQNFEPEQHIWKSFFFLTLTQNDLDMWP